MAVLARIAYGSGVLVRRFGLELAFSMAALVVVAYGMSRALPSADPSRFDRGDAAWVGQLAKSETYVAPVASPQTSASLTVAPAEVAVSPTAQTAAPSQKLAKAVALPVRRPKSSEVSPDVASSTSAAATPVAATASDFLGLSRVSGYLPSREVLLRPFDAVGSTVAGFFRHP